MKKKELAERIRRLDLRVDELATELGHLSKKVQAIGNLLAINEATSAQADSLGIREEIPF